MAPKFDNAESIVTEARYHNVKEAARELSRDFRGMADTDFNRLFKDVNKGLDAAGLPHVTAHKNGKGEIDSFDFGTGDIYKSGKKHNTDTNTPAVTDKKPDAVAPTATDKKPDANTPAVTDKKPDAVAPTATDKKPDANTPGVTDKKPDANTPAVTDKKPDAVAPTATDKKPDANTPATSDKKPGDDKGTTTHDEYGNQVTKWADGTTRIEDLRTGKGSTKYANGDVHTWGPKPSDNTDYVAKDGSYTATDKHGTKTTKWPDGTVRTENSDHSGFTKYADGREHHWNKDQSTNYDKTVDGGIAKPNGDGTTTITWSDPKSKYLQIDVNADKKSGTITYADGHTQVYGQKPAEIEKYGL